MTGLTGVYFRTLTSKRRFQIPRGLTQAMVALGPLVASWTPYEAILIMGEDAFDEALPLFCQRDQDFLAASSWHITMQYAKGPNERRFLLPEASCVGTGLKTGDEVAVVGLGRWLEVWPANKWLARRDDVAASIRDGRPDGEHLSPLTGSMLHKASRERKPNYQFDPLYSPEPQPEACGLGELLLAKAAMPALMLAEVNNAGR